jgi:hypothetical protein
MRRILHASRASLVRSPDLPFLLLWAAALIAGILMFQDFGLSWDEPLYYKYGEAVGYAYSPRAWLSGSFDLENAYGPSAEDHKIYGAAYLLVGRPVARAVESLIGSLEADAWHLVNFLAYMGGLAFFYALGKRWMRPVSALLATTLLASQPLLWGHAFINPKDIPFLAVFVASVYLGFRMVDQVVTLGQGPSAARHPDPLRDQLRKRRATLLVCSVTLVAVLLVLAAHLGATGAHLVLRELVTAAYYAPRDSSLGRLFATLASRADAVPVAAYVQKSWLLFLRARTALTALTPILLIASGAVLFPAAAQRAHRLLDRILAPAPSKPTLAPTDLQDWRLLQTAILPGIILGMLTSIRLVGFLAGALVLLYYLAKGERRSLAPAIVYFAIAGLALLATWPYLWVSPVARLIEVARHMADNPKIVPVLYRGSVFMSDGLPKDYLPRLLAITLTEPTWMLFAFGVVAAVARLCRRTLDWRDWTWILAWFFLPFLYVVVRRPPMYDGYRHFLFILPPVFIVTGVGFDTVVSRLKHARFVVPVFIALLLPGLAGIVSLHPYEYTYYNSFAGGTGGAFRRYETDYWLTCYKETLENLDAANIEAPALFVHRQPAIARAYSDGRWPVEPFDPADDRTFPGSLLLLTTRTNSDLAIHPADPIILTVGRRGATFCVVKRVPSA